MSERRLGPTPSSEFCWASSCHSTRNLRWELSSYPVQDNRRERKLQRFSHAHESLERGLEVEGSIAGGRIDGYAAQQEISHGCGIQGERGRERRPERSDHRDRGSERRGTRIVGLESREDALVERIHGGRGDPPQDTRFRRQGDARRKPGPDIRPRKIR